MHTRLTVRDGGVAGRRRREVQKNVARQIAANTHKVSIHEKSRSPFEHLDGFHTVAVELSHLFVLPD
jgi:hypothetical protein